MSLWKWGRFEFVWNCLWIPASLHERDYRKFPHWWKLMTIQALGLEYQLLALARFTSTAADERTSLQIYSPHFSADVCNYSADLYNGSTTADHMTPTGLSRFRRNRSHHRASPPRCCDCLNILVFICLFGSLVVNLGDLDYSWHLRRMTDGMEPTEVHDGNIVCSGKVIRLMHMKQTELETMEKIDYLLYTGWWILK